MVPETAAPGFRVTAPRSRTDFARVSMSPSFADPEGTHRSCDARLHRDPGEKAPARLFSSQHHSRFRCLATGQHPGFRRRASLGRDSLRSQCKHEFRARRNGRFEQRTRASQWIDSVGLMTAGCAGEGYQVCLKELLGRSAPTVPFKHVRGSGRRPGVPKQVGRSGIFRRRLRWLP